ncbi:FAD-dependent oxidoreductase [Slackia piriformis]|uniref:FAD-dependent oxidoreductase n=1 Tax=Slackia piriformis TaxID=626934 RepID=UPI0032C0F19A
MNERKLSRRAFLGTAGAATGLAALASLGGCAPKTTGAEQSVADDVAANGAMQTTDPSKAVWPVVEEIEVEAAGEGKIAFVAEPIAESDIVATHDVDVVVCGLGPAGDAAALSCAEHGLKTVAVEKQSTGNYNSATIGGTNSKLHQHWGMTYDTDAWIADAMVDCAFQGDMSLYRHFLEKNGEAVDWYIGHFDNQNLDDYPLTFAAGDFPDFRDEYDKTSLSRSWNTSLNLPYPPGDLAGILAGILENAGVEIRYSCPACQLVSDDAGKVTGVIVKSEQGFEKYNCAKGVVLATGGYEFNQQMLKERCRPRSVPGSWLTGAFGNTGDGHQMGIAVGAAEDEFPQPIMLDPEQLMPYLRVNKLGKRFAPEYEPYGHLALAIQAQPGTYDFYIVDDAIDEKIDKIWTPSSSCYGPKEAWTAAARSEKALKADTLEELAELMEVPVDEFVASIERWNTMAAAGKDEDFGFPGDMMMTIDTPPYYATKEFADGLCTAGGLLVDTECRVLDKNRTPIEGLFAAGVVSGGMFYNTYPHNLNCLSHTRNCLMGYTIGEVLGA